MHGETPTTPTTPGLLPALCRYDASAALKTATGITFAESTVYNYFECIPHSNGQRLNAASKSARHSRNFGSQFVLELLMAHSNG